MKLSIKIIIILIVILLVTVGYSFYGMKQQSEQLFRDGYNQGQMELVNYQQQQGIYLYFTNQSGQVQLKSTTLNEICNAK